MGDSFTSSHTRNSMETSAFITPPRQGHRFKPHRPLARAAGEQHSRRSPSNPPAELSPKRRCVSAGTASTSQSFYPSPEPDRTTPVRKGRSPNTTKPKPAEVISLISDDESPALKRPSTQPNKSAVSRSAPEVPLPQKAEIKVTTPDRRNQEPKELISLNQDDESPRLKRPFTQPHKSTASQSAPEVPLAHKARINVTTPKRPIPPRQAQSEPARGPSTSISKADKKIQDCLRKPLPAGQKKDEVGNNYIFDIITADGSGVRLVKIGSTSGSERLRLQRIAKACRHLKIEEQDDPEHVPIRLYKRAEFLMHAELEGFKHSFNCQCKVHDHREYFHVDKSFALEVVQRWRRFCEGEPYDNEGKLRPFWEHRLRKLRVWKPDTKVDREQQGGRWEWFINPKRYEPLLFDLQHESLKLWKWRWLTLALLQSFVNLLNSLLQATSLKVPAFFLVALLLGAWAETCGKSLPAFLSVSSRATGGNRKSIQRRTSTIGSANNEGNAKAIAGEQEHPTSRDLGREAYQEQKDVNSDGSSEIKSPQIEMEDNIDSISTDDGGSVVGDQTDLSVFDSYCEYGHGSGQSSGGGDLAKIGDGFNLA